MGKIIWEPLGTAINHGLDRGVLYGDGFAVPWNGLISMEESKKQDVGFVYLDGLKINKHQTPQAFDGTLVALYSPEEFDQFDGFHLEAMGLPKKTFCFSYRTGGDDGVVHILYNVTASPSSKVNATLGYEVDPDFISWDFVTRPVDFQGLYISELVVDLSALTEAQKSELEVILYGDDSSDPSTPDISEMILLFETWATLRVIYNSDKTYEIDGPDEAVVDNGDGTFTVDWPSALPIDEDLFRISSL